MVVAGGGFGGLYSALRLAELAREGQPASAGPAVDITLVDRSDRFVFLPLLYELAVGEAQKVRMCVYVLGLVGCWLSVYISKIDGPADNSTLTD